jgi:phage tail sheath protein FI
MATVGVSVATSTVGPSGSPIIAYSNGFFVVQSPWGATGVVKICDSFASFLRQFGGRNGLSSVASGTTNETVANIATDSVVQGYLSVKGYFEEKGASGPGVAYVVRAVKASAGATAGSRTYTDGVGVTTITSKMPGHWGNATRITIANSTTYVIITVELRVSSTTVILEKWKIANAAEAANASRKSELVTIALAASGSLPSTAAEGKLNGGTPGTADSYDAADADLVGTVSAANVRTGLQAFNDPRLGSGMVAVPGKYSATVRSGIGTHVASYDRMGVLGTSSGLLLSTVVADLSTTTGSQLTYYWPQVEASDDASETGGTILADPAGYIMGLAARVHGLYRGPHKSPAGIQHNLRSVLNVERQSNGDELVSDSGSNTLDDSFINTIRVKGNPAGIVVWGNNTLATDARYRQFNASHTVNVVRQQCLILLEKFVHEPIDPQGKLYAKVRAELGQFLQQLYDVGALYGTIPDGDPKPSDAFAVICNETNNTDVTLAANELHADVAIVPTPNARQIIVNLQVAAPGNAVRAV